MARLAILALAVAVVWRALGQVIPMPWVALGLGWLAAALLYVVLVARSSRDREDEGR